MAAAPFDPNLFAVSETASNHGEYQVRILDMGFLTEEHLKGNDEEGSSASEAGPSHPNMDEALPLTEKHCIQTGNSRPHSLLWDNEEIVREFSQSTPQNIAIVDTKDFHMFDFEAQRTAFKVPISMNATGKESDECFSARRVTHDLNLFSVSVESGIYCFDVREECNKPVYEI